MDAGRLLKWIVAIAVLVFAWKVALPWLKEQGSGSASRAAASGGGNPCVAGAQHASEAWGSGLGRFVNPPYDIDAWSQFREDVLEKIAAAERDCSCPSESCARVRSALGDLRTMSSELDSSIRNGTSPPGDIVQRQEAIDNAITVAGEQSRAGR
jgi:hypothetical protein